MGNPRLFWIGRYPTEVPFGRGRHTLHWLVALGYTDAKMSFFRMDESVDTGKVIVQIPYTFSPADLIVDVVTKMNLAASKGAKEVYKKLLDDPDCPGVEQDHRWQIIGANEPHMMSH